MAKIVNKNANGNGGHSEPAKKEPKPWHFKKGESHPGRKKGTPNRYTTQLKDALIQAAVNIGDDKKDGERTLVAWLEMVARKDPCNYLRALARLLPVQVKSDGLTIRHEGSISHRLEGVDIRQLSVGELNQLIAEETRAPKVIEHEPDSSDS